MNQITPLLELYSEFIAILAAASILSLVIGWMMHNSRALRKVKLTNEAWEKRYKALEEVARTDAEVLEEQLQNLATDIKELQAEKKALTESLKKNGSSIQTSRAETIELNRQHAETQERLQRIIQQKDREILDLGNRLHQSRTSEATTNSTTSNKSIPSNELTHADTIAIDILDATIQIPTEELIARRNRATDSWKPGRNDSPTSLASDETEALEVEEATVVLDEDALAFVRRTSTRRIN